MTDRRGGRRPGAGRPKGSKNKLPTPYKREISALAKEYTQLAVDTLAEIAAFGDTDGARVQAANALLDRGYGKPKQSHDHTSNGQTLAPIGMDAFYANEQDAADDFDELLH